MSTMFKSIAVARRACLLPGGVKRWESAIQETRSEAKAIMAAYLDGYESDVSYTQTVEVKFSGGQASAQPKESENA